MLSMPYPDPFFRILPPAYILANKPPSYDAAENGGLLYMRVSALSVYFTIKR